MKRKQLHKLRETIQHVNNRWLFVMTILPFSLSINAQHVLTREYHAPRAGDTLVKQQMEYTDPGIEGENVCWDFSKAKVIRTKYNCSYFGKQDSSVVVLDGDILEHYHAIEEAVRIYELETPVLNIKYTIPVLQFLFPCHYNQTTSERYKSTGVYSNNLHLSENGFSYVMADAWGTVILSEEDTLRNVLRVCTKTVSTIVAKNDTCGQDSVVIKKENKRYRWFAKGYRYPVYEIIDNIGYKDNKAVVSYQTAFRFLPKTQRFIEDEKNEELARQDSIITYITKPDIRYSLSVSSNTVNISYELPSDVHLEFIVSDSKAIVYKRTSREGTSGEKGIESIDISRLRRGQYVLYIIANETRYAEKFTIQ